MTTKENGLFEHGVIVGFIIGLLCLAIVFWLLGVVSDVFIAPHYFEYRNYYYNSFCEIRNMTYIRIGASSDRFCKDDNILYKIEGSPGTDYLVGVRQ